MHLCISEGKTDREMVRGRDRKKINMSNFLGRVKVMKKDRPDIFG